MGKVHKMDQEAVAVSVTKKLDDFMKYYDGTHLRDSENLRNDMYHELTHYLHVRVVELTPKSFILVYGNAKNSTVKHGTGPFKTLQEAQSWFFTGGR